MYETNFKFIALFNEYNCSISEFAKMLGIPFMTVSNWLKCNRQMKEYIYDLIVYKLEH